MAEPATSFAGLLRQLRTAARFTQQELAEAADVSLRTVSDLERGVATSPQKDTVRLLGDALGLAGPERIRFETIARGRPLEAVSPASAAVAMRSLPRDVASFTGRRAELEQLAKSALTRGGVVAIHAIGGMAGVGKTAFAVHAAHELATQFPGGQIFLPLHGHTPGRGPVDPADALASLLLASGVLAGQVPADLEARSALWRDRLTARPLLLVLDDAASSDQVRPLLPGAGASLVLVTSRRHLSALDDATTVSLDTLPPDEAAALLVRLAGRAGLATSDPGVRDITRLCGYLPLATGMVARQLRHHPAWTAAGRAAELAAARDRVALLATENLSVTAAFDLSYAQLPADRQRLFRRLGLHPGADTDAYAAAALDGTSLTAARRGLEDLYDCYLLSEPAEGRYRLHDLLREHARTLAGQLDPDGDRDAATGRLLGYYQHTAAVANARIARRTRPGPGPDAIQPAAAPDLAGLEPALAWARAERAALLAYLDHAAAAGRPDQVIALTAGLSGLLERDGPWADAIARHTAAAQAAHNLGDPLSRANALGDLGDTYLLTGDLTAALRMQQDSLALYRDLGDRLGQANALSRLADVQMTGDLPIALRDLQAALALYRELGDRLGQASTLSRLGEIRRLTSDFQLALRDLREALALYRDLGDRLGQARTQTYRAETWLLAGDYRSAAQDCHEALAICRELGDRLGQARALHYRGEVWRKTGDHQAAVRDLQEALSIIRDLGNRVGEGSILCTLGMVRQAMGDYPAASRDLRQAHDIYETMGYRRGQGNALTYLGITSRLTGDYLDAARDLETAIVLFRDIADRGGAAIALNERGALHRVCDEIALAQESHRQALDLSRDIGSVWDEAHALAGLGRCALAEDQLLQGRDLLRQALALFQQIGAPEAPQVRAELDARNGSQPAP